MYALPGQEIINNQISFENLYCLLIFLYFFKVRKNLIDNIEGVTILDDFAVFMDEVRHRSSNFLKHVVEISRNSNLMFQVHAHRTLRTYAYTPIPETEYR